MIRHIILHSPTAYREPATVAQATTDDQVVALWLHARSRHTQRAYLADVERFHALAGKQLHQVTLGDVQDFADSLVSLAPASQARVLSAVKSLLAFAHRVGYLTYDVGRPLRLPRQKNRLAERILPEADVHRMLALEPGRRNRVLLRLLYGAGLRVSELCGLLWRDVQERGDAGQITVTGKGGKTRAVLLSAATWTEVVALRDGHAPTRSCFGHARAAVLTNLKWSESCAPRANAPTLLILCRPIGSAMPTPAMRWIEAVRFIWCRPR